MNTIGGFKIPSYKMGRIGLFPQGFDLQTMAQNENKLPQSIIGFRNSGTGESEPDEKKMTGLGAIKVGQEHVPRTEDSVEKSEREYALFSGRIKEQTLEETAEDKAAREKKWDYVSRFPTMAWSEADKKRIFNDRQICLDGNGQDALTNEQIAYLKDKYDMRHLTAEDTYYFLCDLTEMNVISSEECKFLLLGEPIDVNVEDLSKLQYTTERGTWGWMWDEETGQNILVNSRFFYEEEDEEEDPALIKARIKGYTDDILLTAFGSEDKKEAPSPEELKSEQTLKENAGGIIGELEAKLQSGEKITEQELFNGRANSGVFLDVAVLRWNMAEEVKGITQAAYQDPAAAARALTGYKKLYDECDKLLKIVEQVKR